METIEKHLSSTEKHPLEPFLPEGARILMLGSFPPKRERWSMDFFYPNFINDMWRIVGYIFFGDKDYFLASACCSDATSEEDRADVRQDQSGQNSLQDKSAKTGKSSAKGKVRKFDKDRVAGFCSGKGIALYDTACEVRRLKDNASDKFLEVVTPSDIPHLLSLIPECQAIVTTGQKATDIISETFGCTPPPVGSMSEFILHDTGTNGSPARKLRFWRMPSSSRAYPMSIENKAAHYRKMFDYEGLTENI